MEVAAHMSVPPCYIAPGFPKFVLPHLLVVKARGGTLLAFLLLRDVRCRVCVRPELVNASQSGSSSLWSPVTESFVLLVVLEWHHVYFGQRSPF